jgi:hypothetical protein
MRYTDHLAIRQQQSCQLPAKHSPCIYSDFVRGKVRFVEHGVAKNNGFAEIMGTGKESMTRPEAPLSGLPAEMAAGLQAGMYINSVLVFPEEWQVPQKGDMVGWNVSQYFCARRGRSEAIAGQGLDSSDLQERGAVVTHEILIKKEIVVSHQRHNPQMLREQRQDGVDHRFGIRTPVDIIAEEHKRIRSPGHLIQQMGERGMATVNIADYAGGRVCCRHKRLMAEKKHCEEL